MKTLEILFWALLFVIFYTYIGYGVLLFIMIKLKRLFRKRKAELTITNADLPEITLLIAAYNEKDYVSKKVKNTRELNYPSEKLTQLWITDGSDDGTPDILNGYSDVIVLHNTERNGKIAAMNRGIRTVKTPITIFSDANTMLGKDSILRIAQMFKNPKTGCVSGEKRIMNGNYEAASAAGEGIYWKYESTLKKWDAELNSVVGAAGELFAVRTELFQEVEPDTLLDDFIISLRIAQQGYKIDYNPDAFAAEKASANVKEEMKRKIRIAAGGIQSILRLLPLLNFFRYGLLSFQYISHRVLRWTIAPLALPGIFILNIILLNGSLLYLYFFYAQITFYSLALLGWFVQYIKLKIKILFVPYYFFIMNYAVFLGFFRYLKKAQSVNWERAERG